MSVKQASFKFQIPDSIPQQRSTARSRRFFPHLVAVCCLTLAAHFSSPHNACAQKIGVLVPDRADQQSRKFADRLRNFLAEQFKVLDDSLVETGFRSQTIESPFNLTVAEARTIGAAIGGDCFLLVRAAAQRRSGAAGKPDYYEFYAVVFAVSARTGRLIYWKLQTFATEKETDAEKLLFDSTGQLATEISAKLKSALAEEINRNPAPEIEAVPAENSAAARNFRPPLPFKRLKPAYTSLAYLYGVEATIEIELDVDANGAAARHKIVRWAGFGLDESVLETVRQMNWRHAERDGKALPMRVLLRYNFKKLEK